MSKPQWIRASQEDYERLADAHSVALREMEQLRAALAAAEANLATFGMVELAVRNPNVSSYITEWEGRALRAEAKLADEVRHADELAARVQEVLARDLCIAGDPWCEPALQDEHKTGPRNAGTLASLVAAHAARRAAEAANEPR